MGLVALGVLDFAAGAGLGGLWLVFLGWFLLAAAGSEARSSAVATALAGVRVGDVMSPHPTVLPRALSIDRAIEDYAYRSPFSSFPVVDERGTVTGIVTQSIIKQTPMDQWATTRVMDIARPLSEIVTCHPDDALIDVMGRLSPGDGLRALVFDDSTLVGIITATDVTRALSRAELLRH
jgi:CBS-domain-containing membrane protein